MKDAKIHPENHRDLIVRIGDFARISRSFLGYSGRRDQRERTSPLNSTVCDSRFLSEPGLLSREARRQMAGVKRSESRQNNKIFPFPACSIAIKQRASTKSWSWTWAWSALKTVHVMSRRIHVHVGGRTLQIPICYSFPSPFGLSFIEWDATHGLYRSAVVGETAALAHMEEGPVRH